MDMDGKFHIHGKPENCIPWNVVSDSIRFMQIFAEFPGEGATNDSVVVENDDFRFIRSLSSEHFTYMATRQLSYDATVDDLGDISRSFNCFTSNFSKTMCDTAKVTIDN